MTGIICPPPSSYTSVDGPHCIYKYALNGYLVLLLAALVLEVDDTFLLGGGVFLAGTLASGLLDGLLPPSVPEIFQNKLLSCLWVNANDYTEVRAIFFVKSQRHVLRFISFKVHIF